MMKFLLNMNIPRTFGDRLLSKGFEFRHVAEIGMYDAKDITIIEVAKNNNEIIITNDLDYGHLLAFSGDTFPSVIIFRLQKNQIHIMFNRMFNVWGEIQEPLQKGSIIILEEYTVRIRQLPISKQ